MITGFNTDIQHNGVTYHVQTEDKGLKTPLILSLVYHRGTILASRRSPYNDLLNGKLDEKELAKRLQRQHKLICAAIQAGRVEDLKRMNMKASADSSKGLIAQKEIVPPISEEANQNLEAPIPKPPKKASETPGNEVVKEPVEVPLFVPESKSAEKTETAPPVAKPLSELLAEEVWEMPISIIEGGNEEVIFEPIFEGVSIFEEEIILPAEAVEIITDPAKFETSDSDKLLINLVDEKPFRGGESQVLNVTITRGRSGDAIIGANLMVKVLGSPFRPLIYHAKTDRNGIASVALQIPSFSRGRAAVLIKAISGTEETELRRIIQPG